MMAKIAGIAILIGVLTVSSLFAYYRRELDSIRPAELAKRVQTTVTSYYDRNDKLIWEDKGTGNYKLVVESDELSKHLKEATIAIEDKHFHDHHGISPSGLVRAAWNNATGGETQGGSTLTQQLVKQVFFADEAGKRGLNGIPRKIKEVILAIEVERMYDKDQILTLYLNESPYGGRRNGAESAAQTYFDKHAKDLSIAESAMLAAIPNNPSVYDPYNELGHEALLNRQHKTLNSMVDMGYITQKESDKAKDYPILDHIEDPVNANQNMKAPWFVMEVRKQLEAELGKATVGRGGLKIKTTLDLEAQKTAEEAVQAGAELMPQSGADNMALSSVDVKTGQVIAMVGSVNYSKEVYGQRNAATSPLEPGSSIKPIVDYAPLFKQREGVNYAPGTILRDENIDDLYCAGYTGGDCGLRNYTRKFYGNVTIRKALGSSLNIPAVKAMRIAGVKESLQTAHDLGNKSYCADNTGAGLSAAIGGGCTVTQIEHTNSFASLARGGEYLPISYVLEVKNSSNEVIKKWTDPKPKKAVDPQVAYMISDILSDASARNLVFGGMAYSYGFNIPDVWTASKTGTTEDGNGNAKDSWFMSYSPVVSTGVWMGNHDGSAMTSSSNNAVRRVANNYMESVHKDIYLDNELWKPDQKIPEPDGIKQLRINGKTDIYPSWYDQEAGRTGAKLTFDKHSKKRATDCTPDSARVEVGVYKTVDPITKNSIYIAPDGYDASEEDDLHDCDDRMPRASITLSSSGNKVDITVRVTPGTHKANKLTITAGGKNIASVSIDGSRTYRTSTTLDKKTSIVVTVSDEAGYKESYSKPYEPSPVDDGDDD